MKNLFKTFMFMMAITMFVACNSDDPINDEGNNGNGDNNGGNTTEIVADFDFAVEEGGTGKVTFTNKSENATSYEWSFGDANESVSIEKDPIFTYQASGTYKVTLTAVNGEKYNTKEKEVVIKINKPEVSFNVKDKNYDDWKDIPSLKDKVTFNGGFQDIKIATTDKKVFLYLEGNKTLHIAQNKKFRVHFDIDNKVGTGIQAAIGKGTDIFDGDEGIHYWSMKPNGTIGTTWVDGVKMIDGEWNYDDDNDKSYFEGEFDLEAARTIIMGNPIFKNPDYKDDPQFATGYSEDEIKIYIELNNATWAKVGIISTEDGTSPFSVKLNQYVEKNETQK